MLAIRCFQRESNPSSLSLTTTWGAAPRLAVLKSPKLPSMNQYLPNGGGA